ncbi:ATP-binding protein [Maridesulfovibrio hydrothermalis]|uniref:PP-loop domain protein n=1 Tax=Maridesulfovibrio hydrothermalis AM13 = DSM 14728 TaxID=1121451 RepID=L0RB46_9BACT|nr:ATP-binding protein [Maridesulfovibrio hydrothermalis]CCO23969.1 PP-loop domain protein [Maridesulfovibrio hydrothermalis AM13 = DSM 14728]
MKCKVCKAPAVISLPSHNAAFCQEHFGKFFMKQVSEGIRKRKLLEYDDKILVALSGGKDSLGLMYALAELGYNVTGLHIDLGIFDSSKKARSVVEDFCKDKGYALKVVDFEKEGVPMPLIKKHIRRPICAICGKFKRHYFNKVALEDGYTALATGHNLDDEVARLFANTLRWDQAYLSDQGPLLPAENGFAKKVKPLFRVTEFESANFSFLKGIPYHHLPCPYSGGASFTGHKMLWRDLELRSPGSKRSFYKGFLDRGQPAFAAIHEGRKDYEVKPCEECNCPTSAGICSVCRLKKQLKQALEESDQ